MNNQPTITAVMPSYNHERYIDCAIRSVAGQTFADWELVIVDDCSTDNSHRVIRCWCRDDHRIRATFHSSNQGIARTVNDCIRLANGKYLAMMASDDMFRSDAFEKVVDVLNGRDEYGVALLDGEMIDEENRRIGLRFSHLHRKPKLMGGSFFDELFCENFVCTGVVRKELLDQHGILYDEDLRYLNDWLFWLNLSAICRFLYIRDPLYYYRVHSRNTVAIDLTGHARDWRVLTDKILRRYSQVPTTRQSLLLRRAGDVYVRYLSDTAKAREFLDRALIPDLDGRDRVKTMSRMLLIKVPKVYGLSLEVWALLNALSNRALIRIEATKRLRSLA